MMRRTCYMNKVSKKHISYETEIVLTFKTIPNDLLPCYYSHLKVKNKSLAANCVQNQNRGKAKSKRTPLSVRKGCQFKKT